MLYDFLKTGIAMMNSDATRELLKEHEEPGQKLIEMQREGWDVHGIDRDAGCKALDTIQQSEKELFAMRQNFVHTAMRTFVRTVEDRKPNVLETKAKIPRAKIIKFFDTCNTKLDLPETMEMLVLWTKENKTMPNELIVNMQKDMLESIGFEREHGCRVLSSVGTDFPEDQELFSKLMQWKNKAEQTCRMCVKVANNHMQHAMGAQMGGPPAGVPITEIIHKQLNSSDEMKALAEKARKEVAAMSGADKENHINIMQAKMEVMMRLPPVEREEAMKKAQDINKYDVVKSQIIMLSKMDQKKAEDGMQELATTGSSSAAAPAPAPKAAEAKPAAISVPSTAAPSQMTM